MLSTGYIDSQIKEGDNAQRSSLLESLSNDVLERRTSIGSEVFFLLETCL